MSHRNTIGLILLTMVVTLPTTGRSDDQDPTGESEGIEGFELTGFVDASYSGNLDMGTDTFGLDQVEIDVIRGFAGDPESKGPHGNGLLRADLEWVKDGNDWVLSAEQGYLQYTPAFAPRLTFTLGKFNAPIGFELLDPNEIYQFSHALVFDYALPTNLTGAKVAEQISDRVDVQLYLVNGWDANDLDGAGPKTVGGRGGFIFPDRAAVGLSVITGDERLHGDRTVVDVDVSVTAVPRLLVGGEFNRGTIDYSPAATAHWTGVLAMAHYDFTDWLGLTGRFDWLDDGDGVVFGDFPQTRTAFTLAPTLVLGPGMGALFEIRVDSSDEDSFLDPDHKLNGSATSAAFEMTYSF